MQRLLDFYRAGRRDGTFETGIQRALHRILASPKFMLRVEHDPTAVPSGSVYATCDYELAPHARGSTGRCAGEQFRRAVWLQLRNLRNSVPNEDLFPEFDDNLRQAFQRETEHREAQMLDRLSPLP